MTEASQNDAPSMSVDEMLRVMDVATELRRQRETVEKEFAVDETKRLLRERLLAVTSITGEVITDEEIDAAINQYFSTLYKFKEPPPSFEKTLAHAYVRRGQLSVTLLIVLVLAGVGWYLLHSAAGSVSRTLGESRRAVQQSNSARELSERMMANSKRQASQLEDSARMMVEKLRSVARDENISRELDRLAREIDEAINRQDYPTLNEVSDQVRGLTNQVSEEYEVRIVSGHNEKSGIDRYIEDEDGKRLSAYYLIVEARTSDGLVVARRIRNIETDKTERVTRWAERVPEAVYERIRSDKKLDGVLNESLFAVKRRGFLTEEVVITDGEGKPVSRTGQITKW